MVRSLTAWPLSTIRRRDAATGFACLGTIAAARRVFSGCEPHPMPQSYRAHLDHGVGARLPEPEPATCRQLEQLRQRPTHRRLIIAQLRVAARGVRIEFLDELHDEHAGRRELTA